LTRTRARLLTCPLVFESDLGVFEPYGLQYTLSGNSASYAVMSEIMSYGPPNATRVVAGGDGEDSGPWIQAGVPGASPFNKDKKYFYYHHTNADTISHVPSDQFEKSAAVVAIAALGAAQLDGLLPR
jgi:carboxypeptidase Q